MDDTQLTTATAAAATMPALRTDRYELTMADAAWRSGVGDRLAVFQAFARRLPAGRAFGVFAGLGRLLEALESFAFDADDLAWLAGAGALSPGAVARLDGWRFDGHVDAYAEGELFFPESPVLTVVAPFAYGTLVETLVLSVLNHDSAVASAAARMRLAATGPTMAGGPPTLIEMGGRRAHEDAAVAAARAAYIGGFDVTSNLAAGRIWGVPTAGTAAHAFTLAHAALVGAGTGTGRDGEIELAAFRAQLAAQGPTTTLLVDTFDIEGGIRRAVAAANELGAAGPGAVRIDSGDLDAEARRARSLLDSLGATGTRVVITSDVDEYVIDALEQGDARRLLGEEAGDVALRAPVDAFGVGTRVVSGSGHPSAGLVYKCTAIALDDAATEFVGVGKTSAAKASRPGRSLAWRGGDPVAELVATVDLAVPPEDVAPPVPGARPLVTRVLDAGRRPRVDRVATTAAARARCAASLAELGAAAGELAAAGPALPTAIQEVHHGRA